MLKREFTGARWFIEGDIKACFDSINHDVLIGMLQKKIRDVRIINLIRKFLRAGYLEDWQYHKTYSGSPQGGIISPLLANIYLHELDGFVAKLKSEFDSPGVSGVTKEYKRLTSKADRLTRAMGRATNTTERKSLAEKKRAVLKEVRRTKRSLQDNKVLKYIRYADDFILGVDGSRRDCEMIKAKLTEFIGESLKMKLSEEKTLITYSGQAARFLGYDVTVNRNNVVRKTSDGKRKRTMLNMTGLLIPADKMREFLLTKGIAKQKRVGEYVPILRNAL